MDNSLTSNKLNFNFLHKQRTVTSNWTLMTALFQCAIIGAKFVKASLKFFEVALFTKTFHHQHRILPNDINIPFLSHLHEISSLFLPFITYAILWWSLYFSRSLFSIIYFSFNLTSSTRNSTNRLWQGQSLVEDYPFFFFFRTLSLPRSVRKFLFCFCFIHFELVHGGNTEYA